MFPICLLRLRSPVIVYKLNLRQVRQAVISFQNSTIEQIRIFLHPHSSGNYYCGAIEQKVVEYSKCMATKGKFEQKKSTKGQLTFEKELSPIHNVYISPEPSAEVTYIVDVCGAQWCCLFLRYPVLQTQGQEERLPGCPLHYITRKRR